ncbi:MAG TPA: hypothetical protein PLF40_04070 [Kofleriaceae bacterium]|nr:hypothetical protein [Kofleriaceae bacterium]
MKARNLKAWVVVTLLSACGSPNSATIATEKPQTPLAPTDAPVVADAPRDAPGDAPPLDAPQPVLPSNSELLAAQRALGKAAVTCRGTATLLAAQGEASKSKLEQRKRAIYKLCVGDKWPLEVRQCVATADHDPLQCTAYLTTAARRRFDTSVFAHWNDPD